MGNTPSSAKSSATDDSSMSSVDQKAFHVLQVSPNSPASRAKLVPYFDYIVSVNGVTVLQETPNVVAEMARTNMEKPLRLGVYNSRTDSIREVSIVPSRNWGGEGLLGCSIRYSNTLGAVERAWRVLDIHENSPALRAGLIPEQDWIIGAADLNILNDSDFTEFLIQNKKHPVRLVVYNLVQNACRIVTIVPDFEWGGPGCLGCDIGTGVLNRIPPPKSVHVVASAANSERSSLLSATTPVDYNTRASPLVPSPFVAAPSVVSESASTPLVPVIVPPQEQIIAGFVQPVLPIISPPPQRQPIVPVQLAAPFIQPAVPIEVEPIVSSPTAQGIESIATREYQQSTTDEPQIDYFAMLSAQTEEPEGTQADSATGNIADYFAAESQSVELLPADSKDTKRDESGTEFGEISLQ